MQQMESKMILVLVFIGSAMTAAGGLYFLNIKFCKDPVQAVVMLLGGLIMVAGGEIAVTGSSSSFFKAQQIQTSACELEGETAHPANRQRDADHAIFKHIVSCMKTAGYAWTDAHQHCKEAPVASNALCYLPRGTLARAITTAQVAFE